jgi:hypothetical protein
MIKRVKCHSGSVLLGRRGFEPLSRAFTQIHYSLNLIVDIPPQTHIRSYMWSIKTLISDMGSMDSRNNNWTIWYKIIRHVQIGILCVQEDQLDRPCMSKVVVMLSSETVSLEAPSKLKIRILPQSRSWGGNS